MGSMLRIAVMWTTASLLIVGEAGRVGGLSGWSEWVVWWRSGHGARLATPNVAMQFDSRPFSFHLGQVVHTRVPLSPSSMIWYRSRGGDALQLGR